MKQYGIRISGVVIGYDEWVYKSRKEAEKAIQDLENADKAYDIPNEIKRVVVEREVTPWKTSVDKRRKNDTKKH